MKILNALVILLTIAAVYSCDDESPIVVELGGPSRTYDVNSTDPVKKILSEFYYATDKELIVDPDTADYLYNFDMKNSVRMWMPRQEETYLLNGIEFVKKVFLNGYSDEFKRTYFPYSIIIADTIRDLGTLSQRKVDFITRLNYFAISIGDKSTSIGHDAMQSLSIVLHKGFLMNFMAVYKGLVFPESFYEVSGNQNSKRVTGKQMTQEELYEEGFIYRSVGQTWLGTQYTDYPSKERDLDTFLDFMMKTPESELNVLLTTYKKLGDKVSILDNALKAYGINYKELIYK